MKDREHKASRLAASVPNAQHEGTAKEALRQLEEALALTPHDPRTLNALGVALLAAAKPARAVDLFARAVQADATEPSLWLNLAKAYRQIGDDEGERRSLDGALAIDRRYFMALVRKAELHERLGEAAQAAAMWQGVVAMAPTLRSTNDALEKLVAHARAFVSAHAQSFADAIDGELAPARRGQDAVSLRRFDACIDHALGRRAIYANQCEGLHYPFLPADEYFDRARFSWFARLEAETTRIRAELEALLQDGGAGFKPYVAQPAGTPSGKWSALDNNPQWGAYFLYQFGDRNEEACTRCPATAALVETLPLADIPGRAPTVFFSLLRPGSRIPPHTGVTNTRAIVHLPLIVPKACGFRVGGETREWRIGEAFAFDDTIEHEAWNDSDELRAILILDVWNPHLTQAECNLVRAFHVAADASGHNPEPRSP